MIHLVYAVFDKKVGAYAQPFFVTHEQVALRSFAAACQDKDLTIGKFPEDYALYQVGVFDDASASLTPDLRFVAEAAAAASTLKEVA